MRARLPALCLGIALVAASGAGASEPGDGTDPSLQTEMQRLYELRTRDPQAFVAQSRSLEALPAPTNLGQRQFLRFLSANRAALEGRIADAIALALPLTDEAEDAALRVRANAFVVNMQAGTREFEPALRRLGVLLQSIDSNPDMAGRDEALQVWDTAAIFYNQMGQPALAAFYANRLLDANPSARRRCNAGVQLAIAALAGSGAPLDDRQFDAWTRECVAAGETSVAQGYLGLSKARFLASQGRDDEALALIAASLGSIESTRFPRLLAEAYALDAELLFAAGRFDAAKRQAEEALRHSKDLPTGLPAAMAEKVLYDIARRRGDAAAALHHLQNHVAASQALAEERRIKELAYRTVQHEQLQRAQALRVAGEHHRVLDLEAQVAKAESRNALLAVALLAATLLGFGTWAWRLLLQQRHVRALSQTDALTGFSNRQHFSAEAEAALARSRRSGRPVVLATFDLDHFKRINDLHGHLAGDAVLRTVAAAVHAVPVEPGITRRAGRMGGEEFALLLEAATPAVALAHAEACRAAIAAARTTLDSGSGVVLAVTASFGLAGTASIGHRLHDLLAASDRALYVAKAEGRDRVGVADAAPVRDAA